MTDQPEDDALTPPSAHYSARPDDPFAERRRRMVVEQIERRGLNAPAVLEAMRTVPRHRFVPADLAKVAYDDRPLPIGDDQTISQPYMVAAMTAALDPEPTDTVLEVGTGSGYQAAVLARLAARVITVERHPRLAQSASTVLRDLRLDNVTVLTADGTLGAPDRAPFDRILVTAAAPHVPEPLLAQLRPGGRMVAPIGDRTVQRVYVIGRDEAGRIVDLGRLDSCVFVPLVGKAGWHEGSGLS